MALFATVQLVMGTLWLKSLWPSGWAARLRIAAVLLLLVWFATSAGMYAWFSSIASQGSDANKGAPLEKTQSCAPAPGANALSLKVRDTASGSPEAKQQRIRALSEPMCQAVQDTQRYLTSRHEDANWLTVLGAVIVDDIEGSRVQVGVLTGADGTVDVHITSDVVEAYAGRPPELHFVLNHEMAHKVLGHSHGVHRSAWGKGLGLAVGVALVILLLVQWPSLTSNLAFIPSAFAIVYMGFLIAGAPLNWCLGSDSVRRELAADAMAAALLKTEGKSKDDIVALARKALYRRNEPAPWRLDPSLHPSFEERIQALQRP